MPTLHTLRSLASAIIPFLYAMLPRQFLNSYRLFLRDGGNQLLVEDYDLDEQSQVVDIGGYLGDWSAVIHDTYGCNICVVEPVPKFVEQIKQRFASNNKIRVFPYVISSEIGTRQLFLSNDGTGFFADGSSISVESRRVTDLFDFIGEGTIDLLMINIEGGEYELLGLLLEHGVIARVRQLLVQFHRVAKVSQAELQALQLALSKSHKIIFNYPYVWQRWDLSR